MNDEEFKMFVINIRNKIPAEADNRALFYVEER